MFEVSGTSFKWRDIHNCHITVEYRRVRYSTLQYTRVAALLYTVYDFC